MPAIDRGRELPSARANYITVKINACGYRIVAFSTEYMKNMTY